MFKNYSIEGPVKDQFLLTINEQPYRLNASDAVSELTAFLLQSMLSGNVPLEEVTRRVEAAGAVRCS